VFVSALLFFGFNGLWANGNYEDEMEGGRDGGANYGLLPL